MSVPFGSKDERSFNKPDKKPLPGPGEYAVKNGEMGQNLEKIENDRNQAEQAGIFKGGFGSKS